MESPSGALRTLWTSKEVRKERRALCGPVLLGNRNILADLWLEEGGRGGAHATRGEGGGELVLLRLVRIRCG